MLLLKETPPEVDVARTESGSFVFSRNVEVKVPDGLTLNEFGAYLVTTYFSAIFSKEERTNWAQMFCDATFDDIQALMRKPSNIEKSIDAVYCFNFRLPDRPDHAEKVKAQDFYKKVEVGQKFYITTSFEFKVLDVVETKHDEKILFIKDTAGNRFSLLLDEDVPYGILR